MMETLCVHPIHDLQGGGGSLLPDIRPSTAYRYLESETLQYPGFHTTYNQIRLGEVMAKLEHGSWGLALSSGMAAITTAILGLVKEGDHMICTRELYGGTRKFAEYELPRRGIEVSYVGSSPMELENAITDRTKIIFMETPSNPLLDIFPLKAFTEVAKQYGLTTIVDNTFATPINQLPLSLGVDIVVHSGTKFLGGHNDLFFGVLVGSRESDRETIFRTAKLYGGALAAQECYQAERSIKTLALRVERQNDNAMAVAQFLYGHPLVEAVYYPGLESHSGHKVAKAQMTGYGGILSFTLRASDNQVDKFLRALTVIQPTLSLGGVESIICAPSATSHKDLTPDQRMASGITGNLLRLSVGIEDKEDLKRDLEQAMKASLGR